MLIPFCRHHGTLTRNDKEAGLDGAKVENIYIDVWRWNERCCCVLTRETWLRKMVENVASIDDLSLSVRGKCMWGCPTNHVLGAPLLAHAQDKGVVIYNLL